MFQRRPSTLLIVATALLLESIVGGRRAWADERPPASAESSTRTDRFGDPLPAGARVRLGTLRLRQVSEPPAGLVFSRDGRLLFSAGHDQSVHQWDVSTGKELRRFTEQDDTISALALSPDGAILAAGGERGICLWHPQTGKRLRNLDAARIRCLVFSGDGRTLACGCENTRPALRVWDVATGKDRMQVACPLDRINFVGYAAHGRYLVSVSTMEKCICLADAVTGATLRTFKPANWQGEAVAISPDGQMLVIDLSLWRGGDQFKTGVGLLDLATGQVRRRLIGHEAPLQSAVFSPDGSQLASASHDGSLRFWDPATGRELRNLPVGEQGIHNLVFAADGKTLAGISGPTVRLWEVSSGRELLASREHQGAITGVAVSADGKRVATCSFFERRVCLWDSRTGQLVHALAGHEGYVRAVAFLPDGKQLVSGGGDSTLRLWDAATGKELRRLTLHEPGSEDRQQVLSMGVSADGRRILVCSTSFRPDPRRQPEMTLTAWDTSTGKRLFCHRKVDNKLFPFTGPSVAPDGQSIAVAEEGGLVLREAGTGKQILTLPLPGDRGRPGGFSSDGKLLVAHRYFPAQGGIQVFSLVNPKRTRFLQIGANNTLALSPDDRTLATTSADRIVLWELATGKERGSLEGHAGPVGALSFSADGRLLVSGSEDTTALVWELAGSAGPGPSTAIDAGEQADALWKQLGDGDARKAYRALWTLVATPAQAVALLKERLQPVGTYDAEQVARLIAQLGDRRFAVRRQATAELEKLGQLAEPALLKALAGKPSLEVQHRLEQLLEKLAGPVTGTGTLRTLRAIEVLEYIGGPEAGNLLRILAGGVPAAPITQEAKVSLERLAKRPSAVH